MFMNNFSALVLHRNHYGKPLWETIMGNHYGKPLWETIMGKHLLRV